MSVVFRLGMADEGSLMVLEHVLPTVAPLTPPKCPGHPVSSI